ncbi:MAG: elongation factor Ts [Alphaproteobacteria bacterium]|nr:MAG: elongation factor Ts [Alphaproteobacteria bacterium]
MANVTAAMVKQLRDKTGAGMMDCKTALKESDGDLDAAVDWLRTKGLSSAAKKAGRVAAEGLVGGIVQGDGHKAAIVEINSETDFVARNEEFQGLIGTIVGLALKVDGDIAALKTQELPDAGVTVDGHITTLIVKIGENISLRRCAALGADPGVVAMYVHNQIGPNMGNIGVIVALNSSGDTEKLQALGKQIAMHIAAANPQAVTVDALDPASVEKERAVLTAQAKESGKPDHIVEKMVEGRMRKFYEEVILLSQTFVIDGETKIEQLLKNAAGDLGSPVSISGFVRYELGEGIEKKDEDFAVEVAAVAG